MPYKNQYNANIAQQTHGYAQNNINRENRMNDFASTYEAPVAAGIGGFAQGSSPRRQWLRRRNGSRPGHRADFGCDGNWGETKKGAEKL